MFETFNTFTGLEKFFAICALIGGLFFAIRLILQFVGVGADGDIDMNVDMDVADTEIAGHSDSDVGFRLLSMQGLTAFFLMFGLVGLALLRQSGVGSGWAILGATLAGLATVWIMGKIFSAMKNLQVSGNINLNHALGQEGIVYLTIPAGDIGKVEVTVQGQLKIFDAITEDKTEIKTGEAIKVVRLRGGNQLVVTHISNSSN